MGCDYHTSTLTRRPGDASNITLGHKHPKSSPVLLLSPSRKPVTEQRGLLALVVGPSILDLQKRLIYSY